MVMKFIAKYSFINLLLLFSCAVKSLPSGGPPDLSAPYIKNVTPKEGTSNISLNTSIEIEFNEMVDPNSIKSSIVVIPDIDIKINSYSNKVIIKPEDKWPNHSEFKIKIDRGISDYKNNKMKISRFISFSTSSSISQGYIKGKLFNVDSLKICTVGLFVNINDSLYNYASIQSDFNNNFEFKNIKYGEYTLITLLHDIRDIYNDIKMYPYSIFSEKVIIDKNNNYIDDIAMYLSESSSREQVVLINMFNKSYGEIELLSSQKIPIINKNYVDVSVGDINNYGLFSADGDSINLSLDISNQVDSYSLSGIYKVNTFPIDTIPPSIVNSYADNDNYILEFSEPIKIYNAPFSGVTQSLDTIVLNYEYSNPKTIHVQNITDDYQRLDIENTLITDLSDNKNILSNTMITINKEEKLNIGTGNIYGTISYNGKHDIMIELINIKSKEKTRVIANSEGEFIFKNVFSDVYKLWAYEDINTVSMNYFNGTLNPLKLSAHFGIYEEVIEVRKNWDIEGIEITINNYE